MDTNSESILLDYDKLYLAPSTDDVVGDCIPSYDLCSRFNYKLTKAEVVPCAQEEYDWCHQKTEESVQIRYKPNDIGDCLTKSDLCAHLLQNSEVLEHAPAHLEC
jgi:hypothetical protein